MRLRGSDQKKYSGGLAFGLLGSSPNVRHLSLYSLAGVLLLAGLAIAFYSSNQNANPAQATSNLSEEKAPASADEPKEVIEVKGHEVVTESSTTQSSTSTSTSQSTDLTVNGRSIDVPENGELHERFEEDGQTTTIDVNNQSSGSSNSTNIDVRSFSSSD
jgi:hypothetical protein